MAKDDDALSPLPPPPPPSSGGGGDRPRKGHQRSGHTRPQHLTASMRRGTYWGTYTLEEAQAKRRMHRTASTIQRPADLRR